jgi:hypothetical protein
LKFIFDENIARPVQAAFVALNIGGTEHFHNLGFSGESDVAWISKLSGHRYVVLTNDANLLKIPGELEALKNSDIGLVVTTSGNKKAWEQARDILRHWNEVVKSYDSDRPFAYKLSGHEFRKIPI